jgi:hypothetical protein
MEVRMSKFRWSALCLLLLSLGCFSENNSQDRASETAKSDTATVAQVAEALAALEVPSPSRIHTNEPFFPTKTYQPNDYYDDCPDAIDLLSKTPFNVDSDLLRLAQLDKPLPVRYRAVSILTHRKNQLVVPILERMCSADDAVERFVAWSAYRKAVEEKQLSPPSDYSAMLDLYVKEQDREVHEQIADFLGTARSKEAVPLLLETLRINPGDCDVIGALGMIGDPRAVPAVIAAYEKDRLNRHIPCYALGRLATPQAVEFLIEHLDQYGAVEALAMTKSPQALPALQQRLDKLTRTPQPKELDVAITKVAVTKLSFQNPAPHLLALAEDRSNSEWLRHEALMTLREKEYVDGALHPRLLRLFRDDPDPEVKMFCVQLLEDSSLEGVTEAIINCALTAKEPRDMGEGAFQGALLEALNKRLGYSCRNLKALQDRLQSRPGNPINY